MTLEIELPWTEKYRSKRLDEGIVGHEEIVKRLSVYAKQKNMPNLLFAGPAGVGKTLSAVALGYELYGDMFNQNFLELNASDTRGIDVIRGTIKDFAATLPFGGSSFKIIFLDEADALTRDAQNALRRTIENYARTCRFVLSCVSPDTKIVTPEETEMTIAEFEDNIKEGVLTLNEENNKIEKDKVLYYVGLNPKVIKKKTFRLETMTGRHLDVTEDHPILTSAGWKKAGEIEIGEKVAVFPYLEDTAFPKDDRVFLDEKLMKNFAHQYENSKGYLSNNKTYNKLPTEIKEEIKVRVKELHKRIPECLTKREKDIFDIINNGKIKSRLEIQKEIALSRIRADQLLRSIEQKGFIERIIDSRNKRIHRFKAIKRSALVIRNKVDIKRKIEDEFKIRISYSTIKNAVNDKKSNRYHTNYIISKLKNKNLLPLKYSNKNIGIIARLTGFLLGDGHISKLRHRLIFTGDGNSLEDIRVDLIKLGFSPSKVVSKQKPGSIGGRSFVGTTTWFYLDSLPLALLFECLGVPTGDKCLQEFYVPEWVMNGPRFVKREFLRGLFGSEMYTPKCRKRNFGAILFKQHKSEDLINKAVIFARQLIKLMEEFNVQSKLTVRELNYKRKTGEEMCMFEIMLDASNENIYNFLRQIGYIYTIKKEREGKLASEYLKYKLNVIAKRTQIAKNVIMTLNSGGSISDVARTEGCTVDFVRDRIKNKEVHLSRDFPTFEKWKEEYAIGDSKLVWNKIVSIKDIELSDVRDFTCLTNHNFIANGIISHNCNYSARIIEPIQSRCALFRFKPLKEEEIVKRLKLIAKNEGLSVDEGAYKALVYSSEGDMRKAINYLQISSALKGKITEDTVFKIAAKARPAEIKEVIALSLEGKFEESRKRLDTLLYEYGMSGEDVMQQIYREIFDTDLKEETKVQIIERIGEYNFRLSEGANERIQLEALLAYLVLVGSKR